MMQTLQGTTLYESSFKTAVTDRLLGFFYELSFIALAAADKVGDPIPLVFASV
ncbi:hypothetical protein ACE3MQ_12185 [Paenibacillus lentus]